MTPTVSDAVLMVLKVLFLVGLFIYGIFGVVLVRQEQLMGHVLEESFESIIRFLVIAHLVAAIGIFVLALFLL